MRVKGDGAHEVSHLDGLDELPVGGINDKTIFLTVAQPHVAGLGIDGDAMDHAEFSLSDAVAIPLIDKFAVLVEVDYARGADVVGRITGIGVIGALVRMTLSDVDIAIGSEGKVEGLPEKPLSLGLVPITPSSLHTEGDQ